MSPKTPHPLEHVLSIFGTECSMPMTMIMRLENEDISWNTHIRHRLRDPPTHVLMRTEDSLPQDSFPGLDDSIFKLAAIPWVVLFLWFMWEDVAITSKSRVSTICGIYCADCESSEKSDNEDRSPKTPFSFE